MSQQTRRELVERLRHSVVEAEAAFWGKIKEQFPDHQKGEELPASLVAALWTCLDGVAQAWAIEHVPGMVEALANEKEDRQAFHNGGPVRDERDQT